MNKLKRIVASVMAAATVSAMGITASAYSYPPFKFSLGYNSGDFAAAVKEDTLQTAGVHTTGGTVSAQKPMSVTVYSTDVANNTYRMTDTKSLTSNSDNCTLTYEITANKNTTYYLRGESGRYSLTASGTWNP